MKPSTTDSSDVNIVIVIATFYKDIAAEMLRSAIKVIAEDYYGIPQFMDIDVSACISGDIPHSVFSIFKYQDNSISIICVPGVLEIAPAISFYLASERKALGFVALGCVIEGETSHYEHVCNEAMRQISNLSMLHPIGNGIITARTEDQARARAFGPKKNFGRSASEAFLKMVKLRKSLKF